MYIKYNKNCIIAFNLYLNKQVMIKILAIYTCQPVKLIGECEL